MVLMFLNSPPAGAGMYTAGMSTYRVLINYSLKMGQVVIPPNQRKELYTDICTERYYFVTPHTEAGLLIFGLSFM